MLDSEHLLFNMTLTNLNTVKNFEIYPQIGIQKKVLKIPTNFALYESGCITVNFTMFDNMNLSLKLYLYLDSE